MTIGLTGGSGTGKSTVGRFFEEKGYLLIDCDKLSRDVCSPGEKCLNEIVNAFGAGIVDKDGNLMRRELGSIVFSDKAKLSLLNSITHKHIVDRIHNIIEENHHRNIVIDAPLLFEASLDTLCDVTIAVLSLRQNRLERITKRDNISQKAAEDRISSQHDDSFYEKRCTYTLRNDGDITGLYEALENIFGGIDGKD